MFNRRIVTILLILAVALPAAGPAGAEPGEYRGTHFDVFASTPENAKLLGEFMEEFVGKEFERVFGKPSCRAAVLFLGTDIGKWQMQQISPDELKMGKKYGAQWCWRGPEDLVVALVKEKDRLKEIGPQPHFHAGTFFHYFGVTMLSYHIYFLAPEAKRKEERIRLEERWKSKYLMPFWFASCWTMYSEPINFRKSRWNDLKKYLDRGQFIKFNDFIANRWKDWVLFYGQSRAVVEFLLETGGPEFLRHMLETFVRGDDEIEALKWLTANKERLALTNPPTTIEELEAQWLAWAKKKLEKGVDNIEPLRVKTLGDKPAAGKEF